MHSKYHVWFCFSCLHAGDSHYVFGLSVPFSWTRYLRNAWREFFKFCTNVHLDSRMNQTVQSAKNCSSLNGYLSLAQSQDLRVNMPNFTAEINMFTASYKNRFLYNSLVWMTWRLKVWHNEGVATLSDGWVGSTSFWISCVVTAEMATARSTHFELHNGSSETCGWRHGDYLHILCCLWDELITFWWSKVKVHVTSRPYHSCDLSRTPLSNFFKFGTNIQVELRMNGLEFSGQRSRSQWSHVRPILVNVISREHLRGISSNLAQTSTLTQGWDVLIRIWWSKVKVTVTSQNTFFCRNSRIHMLIMTILPKCLTG